MKETITIIAVIIVFNLSCHLIDGWYPGYSFTIAWFGAVVMMCVVNYVRKNV